jgi:hypothetical protein
MAVVGSHYFFNTSPFNLLNMLHAVSASRMLQMAARDILPSS